MHGDPPNDYIYGNTKQPYIVKLYHSRLISMCVYSVHTAEHILHYSITPSDHPCLLDMNITIKLIKYNILLEK